MAKTGYNENVILEEVETIRNCAKLLPEEREIILIMDDRDRKWKASCSSPTYMRKFEKQGWKCTEIEYYKDGTVCTKFYEAPCKSISIGKYERPKRKMSKEHIEKMRQTRKNQKHTTQI